MTQRFLPALATVLTVNRYPGRGLIASRLKTGELAIAYFLTGRSAASQDRVLRQEGDRLIVAPSGEHEFDPLRHYAAVEHAGDWCVVGNGSQVSDIAAKLGAGADPLTATQDVEYEPDPPICTSRITMMVRDERVWLHAARRSRADREGTDSMLVSLGDLMLDEAVMLTTYESDGETIETARGYVEGCAAANDAEEFLGYLWSVLDPGLRVAAVMVAPGQENWLLSERARLSPTSHP